MIKKMIAAIALSAILAITGCSAKQVTNEPANTATSAPAPTTNDHPGKLNLDYENLYPTTAIRDYAKSVIGLEAPDFTLQNLKGEDVTLKSYRGKNVVLVLAQSTCSACMDFKPTVEQFKKAHPEYTVLLAYFEEQKATVESFLKQTKTTDTDGILVAEKPNKIYDDYKQPSWVPATYFVDKDGIIQFLNVGGTALEQFEDMAKLAF